MKFSLYKNQFDVYPTTLETEWETFVQVMLEEDFVVHDGDKSQINHISLSTFNGYKDGDHADKMYGLILDYDDGMTIDDAIERFQGYEFLFYTSYNHQRVKTQGVTPVDKFRIIFPFQVPCTLDEWQQRQEYVLKFAPDVDPASKKFVQCYCKPATHSDNINNVIMFHNKGMFLDWRAFPKQLPSLVPNAGQSNIKYKSEHKLDPDDVIRLRKGTIRVGDVDKKYQCFCPFHNDKNNPGAIINKSAKGNIFLHCQKCDMTVYMDNPHQYEDVDDDFIQKFLSKRLVKRKKFNEVDSSSLLVFDNKHDAVYPKNMEQRAQMLKKRCLRDWMGVMLLFASEGFGKSFLVVLFVRDGKQVVFTSLSNEQAEKQAEGFNNQGIKAQFIPSREYTLKKMNMPIEKQQTNNPWVSDVINENKTKQTWKDNGMSDEQIEKIWNQAESPKPDFNQYDVVCTTIARVQSWGAIHAERAVYPMRGISRIVPEDTIIFYDDPTIDHFMTTTPWNDSYYDLEIDGQPVEKMTINQRDYAVRPIKYALGYGFADLPMVVTTTEIIVAALVNRQYDQVYQPPLMPDNKMIAGNITMIKTDIVRSRYDGLLPPIMERLKKEGHNFNYIADGQGMEFNLVNNKGRNDLSDTDNIIEISCIPKQKKMHLTDELGWDNSEQSITECIIAYDQMHQSIGRNSGYRWSDKHNEQRRGCIVLCEPRLFRRLYENTRYYVETIREVKLLESGRTKQYDTLVNKLVWLIANIDLYLYSGLGDEDRNNAFLYDVQRAVKRAGGYRGMRVLKRTQTALENLTKHKRISKNAANKSWGLMETIWVKCKHLLDGK